MKVKICGMRELDNLKDVAALQPDFMGFIFYDKSKRYVFEKETISPISDRKAGEHSMTLDLKEIEKVGVFVNEEPAEMIRVCKKYGLTYAQLHGSESIKDCSDLKESGIKVIKAFPVSDKIDFETISHYESKVDLFLFDTKTKNHGGSGKQFNWHLLKSYPLKTPYFLSGGIEVDDVGEILELELPHCHGIDANSRLEIAPGIKDITKTRELISQIRNR